MIRGSVKNVGAVDDALRYVEGLQGARQTYMVQYSIACKQFIEQELNAVLGDKIKHFEVRIEQEGMRFGVSVHAVDDVGRYIYHGTPAHQIVAKGGKAMPDGGNRFMQANHPGTRPMKKEIDNAVAKAVNYAKNSMGTLRGRS